MAKIEKRYPSNVAGKFYVDKECTDCDVCRTEAPEVFKRHDDGYSYVHDQPKEADSDLLTRALRAVEYCPVEAIGTDGDDEKNKS